MRIETRDGQDYYVWDMTFPVEIPEPPIATFTFNPPLRMDMSTNYNISVNNSVTGEVTNSLFAKRSVSTDVRLPSTKLTTANRHEVAAHIIKTVGGLVEVRDNGLSVSSKDQGDFFEVGAWLVEDYDFVANKAYFRTATIEERKTYNLR